MGKSAALIIGALSAATSVAGGIAQAGAARDQAKDAVAQAEDAARKKALQAMEFEKQQKLNFLKSGVTLEGSPLLVLAETRERGSEDVSNILEGGTRQSKSFTAQGRSALFSGLTKATGSVASAGFGAENMAGQSSGFNPMQQAPLRKPI